MSKMFAGSLYARLMDAETGVYSVHDRSDKDYHETESLPLVIYCLGYAWCPRACRDKVAVNILPPPTAKSWDKMVPCGCRTDKDPVLGKYYRVQVEGGVPTNQIDCNYSLDEYILTSTPESEVFDG